MELDLTKGETAFIFNFDRLPNDVQREFAIIGATIIQLEQLPVETRKRIAEYLTRYANG